MEDLRRDLHQLQAQVQALRAAISEAAELDRQRAAVLTRALKNLPNVPEANAVSPPSSRSEPAAPEPRPAASASPTPGRAATAQGSLPPQRASEVGGGQIRGKVEVPAGEPVAYVYVENIIAPPAKGEHKIIQQSGKKFLPGWAVIQRGTAIELPNHDNIYHNVFSLSAGNSFDSRALQFGRRGQVAHVHRGRPGRRLLQHPSPDGGQRAGGAEPLLRQGQRRRHLRDCRRPGREKEDRRLGARLRPDRRLDRGRRRAAPPTSA